MGDANEIWWVRTCFNSGGSNEFMHVSSSAGCGNYVYLSLEPPGNNLFVVMSMGSRRF
jgi:hypothetical protein